MPIYAYKCEACGFPKDVLQKLSDDPLVNCPSCGAQAFQKQLTAAGFQLKGSGWYVTDFRDGKKNAPSDDKGKSDEAAVAAGDAASTTQSAESASAKPAEPSASSAAAPAAAPAPAAAAAPSASAPAPASASASS